MKRIIALLAFLIGSSANAGVILSGGSVVDSSMGEYGPDYLFGEMLSQTGLSSTYTSGVTDFATFTGSGVTHSGGDSNSWLSSPDVLSGYVTFDLGAIYDVMNFVMWNGTSGISASANRFSIETSLDNAGFLNVGNFGGQQADYNATVYDMADSSARYVRLNILSNFGNSCCTGIGDIAFDVTSDASVPVPATLALFGIGLAGLGWTRRKA